MLSTSNGAVDEGPPVLPVSTFHILFGLEPSPALYARADLTRNTRGEGKGGGVKGGLYRKGIKGPVVLCLVKRWMDLCTHQK